MAFVPKTCPNPNCVNNDVSFIKKGFFKIKRTGQKVRRFQCKGCGKTFSSHTFKPTCGQHKPHLNPLLGRLLAEGSSFRGAARSLEINYKTVYRKFLWLSEEGMFEVSKRQSEGIKSETIYIDEQESIEHTKLKPLSIAVAVNENYEVLSVQVASMPAKGRIAALSRKKYGLRADERPQAMSDLMADLKLCTPESTLKELVTDGKSAYSTFAKNYFPNTEHKVFVNRKVKQPDLYENKKKWDPLFPINQRCAKFRSDIRRLTRRSWCTTKIPENLQRHLIIYMCYNNKWPIW